MIFDLKNVGFVGILTSTPVNYVWQYYSTESQDPGYDELLDTATSSEDAETAINANVDPNDYKNMYYQVTDGNQVYWYVFLSVPQ